MSTPSQKVIDTLKEELSKISKEKDKIIKKNIILSNELANLKQTYKSISESASYRLGHLLLKETRSIRSLVLLPGNILKIWQKSKHRKENKKILEIDRSILNKQKSNPKHIKIENLKNLKIACIMDTFSFNVFAPEAKFSSLTPYAWQKEIETIQPDILFVESAWRGKDDLWQNKIHILSQELADIIVYCRQNGIATIFWNKEDPYHFNDFIDTIQYFDFVFTTDSECIPKYKKILKHENVYLLPFACQPKIHNPIESFERKDAFVFAGAYYPHFPKRMKVFESFIKHLSTIGTVEIYDRHLGNTNTSNIFPEEFHHLIKGTLAYNEIDKAYKGYKYALNLNSITDSPTMFSRRVFELLASNTLILSNYAKGIDYLFHDLIIATDDGDELIQRLGEITDTPIHEKKIKLLALRKVLSQHVAGNRLAYLASKVYQQKIKISLPSITFISYAKDEKALHKIYNTFHRQSYDNKYLIILLTDKENIDYTEQDNIQYISYKDQKTFSEIDHETEYIAGIAPDDYYGENYLYDLALASTYFDGAVIGKKAYYDLTEDKKLILQNQESSYNLVQSIPTRSSMIKTKELASSIISDWIKTLPNAEYTDIDILAIDEFNYVRNMHNNPLTEDELQLVCDLYDINIGIDIDIVLQNAEAIEKSD